MRNSLAYRISLGLSVLLTAAAYFTSLTSLGALINGYGSQPAWALVPWTPLGLLLLTAINCTIRSKVILQMEFDPETA